MTTVETDQIRVHDGDRVVRIPTRVLEIWREDAAAIFPEVDGDLLLLIERAVEMRSERILRRPRP